MKDKERNFSEILDECVAKVQAGEKSISDCLRDFPEYKDELESLLKLYVFVQSVPEVKPAAVYKEEARQRFLDAVEKRKIIEVKETPGFIETARKRWTVERMQNVMVKFVAVVLAFSLMGGGVAVASEKSLPDSPLYAVKLTIENARVALTFNKTAKTNLLLKLTEKRLLEVTEMVESGRTKGLEIALREMNRRLKQAQEKGDKLAFDKKQELYQKMLTLTKHQQAVLGKVLEKVPEQAQEAIRHAIEISQQGHKKAQEALEKGLPKELEKPGIPQKLDEKTRPKTKSNNPLYNGRIQTDVTDDETDTEKENFNSMSKMGGK
ncbi:MAG: DUF5667 domain-containing protein [Candidatus Subteraquimicrobiales bacterium]|nr:DUF5667 domain-containing protein [Candidatus Subteraquimicrobiales bacterium]